MSDYYGGMDYEHNIEEVYRRATPQQRHDGMVWYSEAQALALELSPECVWRGAGVISALSPLKKWDLNVRLARQAFDTGIATGNIGIHNEKAQRILDGEYALDVLSGPKTRNFCIAIATGGINGDCTVDSHGYDIAMGYVHTNASRPKISGKRYEELASAYRAVADRIGINVNQLQAICWTVWRQEKGIK